MISSYIHFLTDSIHFYSSFWLNKILLCVFHIFFIHDFCFYSFVYLVLMFLS